MQQLVVLGPLLMLEQQVRKLKALLEKHGLPGFDESATQAEVWDITPDSTVSFGCLHMQVDITLDCVDTTPEVQAFTREAMIIPGVYLSCPEHDKRRYWEKQPAA